MLQFKNRTPFEGAILLLPDADGVDSLYTVVKGTFTLADRPRPAEKQLPVALADQYRGDPGKSSLRIASDVALLKPGTDVLLVGTAYAPGGRPAPQADVTLRVGPVNKTVRVFGDRVWEAGMLGASISRPAPFERVTLTWERAFGGSDETPGRDPELHAEPRNPVGRGFRVKDGHKELGGLGLPNLENPKELIKAWKDRPAPAGFGPLCPHWEPRRSYAGTYDEKWQKQRAPYLPADFNPLFFQLAPPDQVVPGYLKGAEPIEVRGATPEGVLRSLVPAYRVQATYRLDGAAQVRPANLDTVLIEPDEGRLVLVWRAVLACDKKALRVREVEASLAAGGSEA
jgi:hypothetical protein